MDRRGFLRLFGASAVGVALTPVDAIWRPIASIVAPPVFVPPVAAGSLLDITKAFAGAVGQRIGSVRALAHQPAGVHVGDIIEGVQVTDWVNLEMYPFRPGEEYAYARYIEPAAGAMANEIKHRGMRAFAPLTVPDGDLFDSVLVTDEASGVVVRALSVLDPHRREHYLRMDVIGGRC